MPEPPTIQRLRRLALTASEIKSLTGWPDAMIEDYLNIINSIITIASLLDIEIDQKIEEIDTDFLDGSIPYSDDEKLVEDNTNLIWNAATLLLFAKSIGTDFIDWTLNPTVTHKEGRTHWNSDDGCLETGMPGGSVVLQHGQELLVPRAKAVGSNILNGQAVYVSGTTGQKPEMSLAMADAIATSHTTIAVATEDVAQNQFGYFTAFGLVRDVDTSALSAGPLYLSDSVSGGLTNTAPSSPNYTVCVAYCIYVHANHGIIFVGIKLLSHLFSRVYGMSAGSIPHADSNGFLTETNPGLTFDGTNLAISADNAKAMFGLANDFSIYYDAVNAIINPKEVGSGILQILGALGIDEVSTDPSDPPEGKAVLWKSDGTGTGDDGDILYKEQSGSVVTKGALKWRDFTPSSITLNAGTLNGGDETDVQAMFDGNVYDVQEVAATPGWDIEFNFTGVDRRPNFFVVRWIYNGSATHFCTWDIYNYTTAAWDQVRMFKDSGGYYDSVTMYVPIAHNSDYVDGSGNAKVRSYHHTAGDVTHNVGIDYVGLTHSLQGII